MKSRWIVYNGKRIMYGDFRAFGTDAEALKAEVNAADKAMCAEPPKTVLAIADVSGTTGTREIVMFFKQSAARTQPYVRKQAVVGVEGVRRLLVEAVSRFSRQPMSTFGTVEEAQQWLTQD